MKVPTIEERAWTSRAKCLGHDTEFFYPEDDTSVDRKRIRDFCRTCPVIVECAVEAVERREPWGYWGGLSRKERRKIHSAEDVWDAICRILF
jgi:WhiB family redox-sensing transcriptional regulator